MSTPTTSADTSEQQSLIILFALIGVMGGFASLIIGTVLGKIDASVTEILSPWFLLTTGGMVAYYNRD